MQREVWREWFPNGKKVGHEWCSGSLQGESGDSFKINVNTGLWRDFNGQEEIGGKGMTALYARLHGLKQLEAGRELAGKYGYGDLETVVTPIRPQKNEDPAVREIAWVYPPLDAPRGGPAFKHIKHGLPWRAYEYPDENGRLIFVNARYHTPAGKEFAPWTWQDGQWRAKALPAPRPLYNLPIIKARRGVVIIVEGEKAADALLEQSERAAVTTWSGGAGAVKQNDWTPLAGRPCLLWPDADTAGFKAMEKLTAILLALHCKVSLVDTDGLAEGFDAADLVHEGVKSNDINVWLRPRIKLISRPAVAPSEVQRPTSVPGRVTLNHETQEVEDPAPYALAARYGLTFSKQGVHANMANATAIISGKVQDGQYDPLHYDVFLQKVMTGQEGKLREWGDWDTLKLLRELQARLGIHNIRKTTVDDAVTLYAYQNQRNCVLEWLESLKWDREPRVEQLFIRGFGAKRNEYMRAVGRCFMTGVVARIYLPGCQLDNMPVLEGEQGIRKTSGLKILGGPWYAECQESVSTKDFYLVLQGKMLVEISELSSFKKADMERINGIVTCRDDRYRAPYERRASDHPRSCAFAATTNSLEWNRDDTGARRFWPVRCTAVDTDWLALEREQLFAEAVALYKAGRKWWDVPDTEAKLEQNARRAEDTLASTIRLYLRARHQVTLNEVMREGLGLEKHQAYDKTLMNRATTALRHLGWLQHDVMAGGERFRVWRPAALGPPPAELPLQDDEPDQPA